jgi:hypothetical protein
MRFFKNKKKVGESNLKRIADLLCAFPVALKHHLEGFMGQEQVSFDSVVGLFCLYHKSRSSTTSKGSRGRKRVHRMCFVSMECVNRMGLG